MGPEEVINLSRDALQMAFVLALPVLGVALVVGLVVSTIQAVTQVHDQTIGTVVKIVAVFIALLVCMPWLIEMMSGYSQDLVENIPRTISGNR